MAKLFKNTPQTPAIPERQKLENRYNSARGNLLLVVAFTLINIILIFTQSYSYFLFSASVPYILVNEGWFWTGRYPAEYYEEGVILSGDSFLYAMAVIAAVILVVYFLCWLFSKKNRVGWLITALVFFALDTVFYVWYCGISAEGIIDLLFHAWVLYYLISGIAAHAKLKKLPPEEIPTAADGETTMETDSVHLRYADTMAKHRVLAEAQAHGYDIVYRRVGKVNELVINGRVYDEYTALVEMNHSLNAHIDGHSIEAGFNGSHSYITVDGETVVKKLRIY